MTLKMADQQVVLSRFERLHELGRAVLSAVDDACLKEILSVVCSLEMEIWLEMDRRAGKPWTLGETSPRKVVRAGWR